MTNKHYKGNEMIRRLVIGADFVILNIVLLFYTQYGQELIPAYFDKATKITFFVANAALFLGEDFYIFTPFSSNALFRNLALNIGKEAVFFDG